MRAGPHLPVAVALLAGPVGLGAGGGAPAGASSCLPVPQTMPSASLLAGGGGHRVRVGGLVYVVRVEPEKYSGARYPAGFPWLGATSSDRRVLGPVRLCPSGPSSL